jgi:hypothetical protein
MITERILKCVEIKGITKYKFCKDLGFSNGFLDKPREITTDKYANILVYFPDINPEWLLTGNGPMLRETNCIKSGEISPDTNIQTTQTANIQGKDNNNNLNIIGGKQKNINMHNTDIQGLAEIIRQKDLRIDNIMSESFHRNERNAAQLLEKDTQIGKLIDQNTKLIEQLNKLIK